MTAAHTGQHKGQCTCSVALNIISGHAHIKGQWASSRLSTPHMTPVQWEILGLNSLMFTANNNLQPQFCCFAADLWHTLKLGWFSCRWVMEKFCSTLECKPFFADHLVVTESGGDNSPSYCTFLYNGCWWRDEQWCCKDQSVFRGGWHFHRKTKHSDMTWKLFLG